MRLAYADLCSWFEREATIIVPSRLAAEVVRQEIATYQLSRGLESWHRTLVYSVDAWLAAMWNEARYRVDDIPTLLSGSQEHLLWQQIIEQEHANLFDIGSTARLSMRAAKLAAEWQVREGESWNDHEDAEYFRAWHKLFRRKCREKNWITHSELWALLPAWIAVGVGGQAYIVFAGFDAFTPALERVKQALGHRAVIADAQPNSVGVRASAKSCNDFAQEIEHAARWSRAVFEQQPDRSIGIFVPDLARHRSLVERTFQQVFYPSAALGLLRTAAQTEVGCVFHINAAAPLRTHPLVASGLLLLELARPRIDISVASAMLRSPFIPGASAERSQRAFADLDLRKKRELDIGFHDLEFASRNCPLLKPVWTRVRLVLRGIPDKLELSSWSESFADILQAVPWPGDVELTAEEQDILDAWKRALSTLATLGLVSGHVSYDVALTSLRGLLSGPAAERGDWFSPIQILDAYEASGLHFDRVFVTGLSDETWPPRVNINPLVPLKLQHAYHVPGSSPQSAQVEQERTTRALFATAPVVIATYSGRLSSLAERFVRPERIELTEWQGKLPRESYTPTPLDQIEDTNAPPYVQKQGTRGGASLIKAQSLCPFRAFAEFRLAAPVPEDASFGFDSRERGGFMHEALQKVWNQIRTYEQLLATPQDDLRRIVQGAVDETVTNGDSGPFHELMSRTERERLEKLICEWLDVERLRKHSFTVETLEQDRFYDFPGLRLRLRVDRLDRLRNGKLVLIDYKSGSQTRGKLKCPRPSEPQLLVYATAVGKDVDGIFFGELTPRQPRAVGFSREKIFQSQSTEVCKDWDLFLAESQEEVKRLAREFVLGRAAVDPIKSACEYCHIKPFCRVNEKTRQGPQEE